MWSFQDRALLFRLAEHDHGVAFVDFSHDDRLLLSGGVPEDRKILIWDMSNGCIVSIVQHDPAPTTVAAWGGMVRCGMKRRLVVNGIHNIGLSAARPGRGGACDRCSLEGGSASACSLCSIVEDVFTG